MYHQCVVMCNYTYNSLFSVSSNTEYSSVDLELNYTYSEVDKPGITVLGQNVTKVPTPTPRSGEDTSNPKECKIEESAQMSHIYDCVDESSERANESLKKSPMADEYEGNHHNSPTAQETQAEVAAIDDYTYAEVTKKPKPSLCTGTTSSQPSAAGTQDDELSYLYSSVDKQKARMD